MMDYTVAEILALVTIAVCLTVIVRKRDFFHPISFQATLVLLFIGARVFWVIDGQSGLWQAPAPELLVATLLFYGGFFVVAALMYSILPRLLPRVNRLRFEIRPFWRSRRWRPFLWLPHAAFGLVALGIILSLTGGLSAFFSDVTGSRGIYEGRWALIYGLFSFAIAAIIVYTDIEFAQRWRFQRAVLAALLAFACIGALLTGFRGMIIQLFIHFLVLRQLITRRQSFGILAAYGVFAILALHLMTLLVYGDLFSQGFDGVLSNTAMSWADMVRTLNASVYGRYYSFEATARVLQKLWEGSVPFDGGRFIKLFPTTVLPSALVGPKPSVTQEMCSLFMGDHYPSGKTSCVTSAPAFMYWQMGWLGYALACAAYGAFMRFWVRIYETPGYGNVLFAAITYPYFMMTFTGHIGTVSELIYLFVLVSPVLRLTSKNQSRDLPLGAC